VAYIMSGITLAVPAQAERPREVAPPPARVSAGSINRPRTSPTPTRAANAYLQQVLALRLKQRELELYAKKLAEQLNLCKRQVLALKQKNAPTQMIAVHQARCTSIERAIAAAIVEIKRLAAAANKAAEGAIASGAPKQQVVAVSMTALPKPALPPVTSWKPAVESAGAKITADGQIVPTTAFTPVETPPVAESIPSPPAPDQEPTIRPQGVAVSVSSGSIFTGLLVVGAMWLGYRALAKKGHA
jgi:hypothetical protein